jgi:uncharacterized protein (TIGR03435 family)
MSVTLGNTLLRAASRPHLIALRRPVLFIATLLPAMVAICAQNNPIQPLKPMARNADPTFDVAVVKPADPNDHSNGFHLEGRRIFIENVSMTSLICFAYSIQKSQIVGAPGWFDEKLWDIQGVPDAEGVPDWPQYRHMLQKLLSARFSLQMHHDKRELLVYTLTIAKGGPKLEKSKSDPDALNDQSGHGVGSAQFMKFTNDSMTDFAQLLQLMGDRPVIDQTNLSGRYDFTLLWTPNEMRAAEPDAAPGLFTAVQEQLGLKLEAARIPADVFVIDAATRPTQN